MLENADFVITFCVRQIDETSGCVQEGDSRPIRCGNLGQVLGLAGARTPIV